MRDYTFPRKITHNLLTPDRKPMTVRKVQIHTVQLGDAMFFIAVPYRNRGWEGTHRNRTDSETEAPPQPIPAWVTSSP